MSLERAIFEACPGDCLKTTHNWYTPLQHAACEYVEYMPVILYLAETYPQALKMKETTLGNIAVTTWPSEKVIAGLA